MTTIKGITIQLINKIAGSVDIFNNPTYTDADPIDVDNVLVGEPSAEEVTNSATLYGRKVKYTLAIPKGDANVWEGDVIVWGTRYHIITSPTQGIEELIPLDWNKKVMIEEYHNGR